PYRVADLHEGDVHQPLPRDPQNPGLDLVGDVRDDLHGAPEVVAAPFLLDDGVVDLPRGHVVLAVHGHAEEPLVVPHVEVRLGAVVGDGDVPVLVGAHGAGVHVQV